MSTPCRILRKNPDNTITAISLHWDGYPSAAGRTLLDHYSSDAQITMLFQLGDLSKLGETPFEDPDYWNSSKPPIPNGDEAYEAWLTFRSRYCGSYAARGERGVAAQTFRDMRAYSHECHKEAGPYEYLWDGREWKYRECYGHRRFRKLTEKVVEEEA